MKTVAELYGFLQPNFLYFGYSKEAHMSAQPITQQVQWQDLIVRNEVDTVLEIAQKEGWEDCEIFGYGEMITEPQEAKGWKLIPADLYEYSIPAEGIVRLHQIINAGIRIQGIIIADDEQGKKTQPSPTIPSISLPSLGPIASFIGSTLRSLLAIAIAGTLLYLFALSLIYLAPLIILGLLIAAGTSLALDPKLVILVDDGNGSVVWVSVFTWYD